jgi:MerR family mercuric resistance operon transcriptional regulator
MVRSQAFRPLTISGLARAAGVGVETIRYYQRRGLLAVPEEGGGASANRVRRYGYEYVHRLRFIRGAQTAGFTLAQIRELLALDATLDRARVRHIADAQLKVLDQRIGELAAARDALSRLTRTCRSGSKGPCPILQAFE